MSRLLQDLVRFVFPQPLQPSAVNAALWLAALPFPATRLSRIDRTSAGSTTEVVSAVTRPSGSGR
jgi:hypothetical protein